MVLEFISEHCAEIHITETQITGINDAKNTEKRVAHANGGLDFLNHSENQTPFG